MRPEPPKGFEELGTVVKKAIGSSFSAIGVVTDFLPACKTKGKDYVVTFSLSDPSWLEGEGLKCRFFGPTEKATPNVSSIGDVVVLQSSKLKTFNGDLIGLSTWASSWIVFHQHEIPTSETIKGASIPFCKVSDDVSSPTEQMMEYAITICNSRDRTGLSKAPPATSLQLGALASESGQRPSASATKFQLIQDLVPPRKKRILKFAELLGEVRKVFINDFKVELTITDYTSNDDLYHYAHASEDDIGRDGDEFNYTHNHSSWRGPWGKLSMVVTAWDAHAGFAREHVGQGSLVFLQNVQICLDREGVRLEGNLRGDRLHPARVGISIYKPQRAREDGRVKALLRRKRDYEAGLKLHGIKGLEETKRQKDEAASQAQETQKLSKSKIDKKRKKEKEMAKKRHGTTNNGAVGHTTNSKLISSAFKSHVRINKVPTTVTTVKISEINEPATLTNSFNTSNGNPITLPFKNNLYHLGAVRCVDFNPPNIADFAVPHKSSEYESLSDYERSSSGSDIDMTDVDGAEVVWEWRFELLIEDAHSSGDRTSRPVLEKEVGIEPLAPAPAKPAASSSRIKLLVAGSDAEFLLRNIAATDLRSDPHALTKLREKLFLLWGNLQERKEEEEEAAVAAAAKESEKENEKKKGEGQGESDRIEAKTDQQQQQQSSAGPFECLVREYGVKRRNGGWERVFAMFGTSIVS